MTKYIFFFLVGVLTTDTTGSYTTAKFFADKFEIDFDELFQYTKPFDSDIDAGKISLDEVWDMTAKKYGKEFKEEYIKESFLSTPIDSKILEIVEKLIAALGESGLYLHAMSPVPLVNRRKNIEFVSLWKKYQPSALPDIRQIVYDSHNR